MSIPENKAEETPVQTTARTGADVDADHPGCGAGIELHGGDCSGVFFSPPVFANTSPGTASTMVADAAWFTWSASDPDAIGAAVTDQWRGTVTITEWTSTDWVFALDGEHCPYQDEAACAPTTGTLHIAGELAASATAAGASRIPIWQDVATSEVLCSADWP